MQKAQQRTQQSTHPRLQRTLARSLAPFALALLVGGLALVRPAAAQDDAKAELQKSLGGARQELLGAIDKLLGAGEERILAQVSAILDRAVAANVAKLEAALKDRDRRIAELEAKVQELALAKAAAPAPAPPKKSKAFLGIGFIELPPDLKEKLKLEGGALITQVQPKSPAAGGGLKEGDVIVDIHGKGVTSETIVEVIGAVEPDQEVNITVVRDGARVTQAVKLVDREKFLAEQATPPPPPAKKEPVKLGVTIREDNGTLVVESVDEGFTGSVVGLKSGDKLGKLNGKDLKTIEDISSELAKVSAGEEFKLVVVRGEETISLTVVGAADKAGAKVVSREVSAPQPKQEVKARGVLGVAVVPDVSGVRVESVRADSAAAKGGVKAGDLLKKLNGADVADVEALQAALSKLSAGDAISITVERDGKAEELKGVTLLAAGAAPAKPPEPAPPQKRGALGLLATQTPDQTVVIKSINAGGAAEKAALQPGDTILSANGRAVKSFDDLASVLQGLHAGDSVTLKIRRGSEEKEFTVTLGEA